MVKLFFKEKLAILCRLSLKKVICRAFEKRSGGGGEVVVVGVSEAHPPQRSFSADNLPLGRLMARGSGSVTCYVMGLRYFQREKKFCEMDM